MTKYIPKAMIRLNHPASNKLQYAPYKWNSPAYGKRLQMAPDPDYSELLNRQGIKFNQTVVGIFLYYVQALDPNMICSLNDISSFQARTTKDTMEKTKWFLDYAETYPNAII